MVKRISLGPGETAGYFSRLKAGLESIDIKCEHFVLTSNKFKYEEENYFLKSVFEFIPDWYKSEIFLIKCLGYFFQIIIRAIVFIYALINYDAFIFPGSGSFFKFYELPVLKLLGKKVIVVYLGSDARPPFFNGRHLDSLGSYATPEALKLESIESIRLIRRVEKFADVIINHTAMAQFCERPFIRTFAIGVPTHTTSFSNISVFDYPYNTKLVRILHAPSRPLAKGSLVFRQIIDDLRGEGYLIDFVELNGVPNSVVLNELKKCDFVLDELYSDLPLGILGTEAAMFGKPTVVGGYYTEQYSLDNPDMDIPPSLYVAPENIKETIRRLIDDREFRLELGKRAQNFIKKNWDVKQVATNYLQLLEGNIPEQWVSSPADLTYYWGWGLSKENWHMQVQQYVSLLGEDALFLDHNPNLKKLVLKEIHKCAEVKI